MPVENQKDVFELNGSQPAPLPLLAFVVGDCDWVAAVNEAGARRALEEMNGEEPGAYDDWDVDLVSAEWLAAGTWAGRSEQRHKSFPTFCRHARHGASP